MQQLLDSLIHAFDTPLEQMQTRSIEHRNRRQQLKRRRRKGHDSRGLQPAVQRRVAHPHERDGALTNLQISLNRYQVSHLEIWANLKRVSLWTKMILRMRSVLTKVKEKGWSDLTILPNISGHFSIRLCTALDRNGIRHRYGHRHRGWKCRQLLPQIAGQLEQYLTQWLRGRIAGQWIRGRIARESVQQQRWALRVIN